MSNAYTKIYLHLIFAVKGRQGLIPEHLQPAVHNYMAGVLQKFGHYPVEIGGIENHVHILVEYSPSQPLADMIRDLKIATTKFINTRCLIPGKFNWQRGYACFSYAPSQIDAVRKYIANQHEHHKRCSLREEVVSIYRKFNVDFDMQYIFEE